MYSHLIHEDAYHKLTRAHDAINALSFLLEKANNIDFASLIDSKCLLAISEYIYDDLEKGIYGCKEIKHCV